MSASPSPSPPRGLPLVRVEHVAARAEASSDLPGNPERQFGLAASHEFADPVTVTVDYLRGFFDDGPDRDAFALMLAFRL